MMYWVELYAIYIYIVQSVLGLEIWESTRELIGMHKFQSNKQSGTIDIYCSH